MRKSIKRMAATLMAATMVLGSLSMAYADEEEAAPTIQDIVEEGETIYSIGANGAAAAWAPVDTANQMTAVDGLEGVYKAEVKISKAEDGNEWARRFAIIQTTTDTENTWNRALIGVPSANPVTTDATSQCLTNIRVNVEEDTTVTVYFDSATYGVAIKDEAGEDVPYLISWVGNDDDELTTHRKI